jgi:hypothetical protein
MEAELGGEGERDGMNDGGQPALTGMGERI